MERDNYAAVLRQLVRQALADMEKHRWSLGLDMPDGQRLRVRPDSVRAWLQRLENVPVVLGPLNAVSAYPNHGDEADATKPG